MKILFSSAGLTCTDHLPLGEGLIAFSLAKALTELGHEVTLWSPQVRMQGRYPRLTAVEVGGYPFYPVPGELRYDWYAWRYARRAAARFRAERGRFDLIHHAMPFDVTRGYSLLNPPPAVIGPLFAPWELGPDEYGEQPPAPTGWLAGKLHWRLIHRYQRYAEGQCRRTYARVRRILVRLRAIDELADRLATLLGDPESRRAIGAANRREIEARYTWPALARELLAHYGATGARTG